jgi:HK97 family phage major capsid protein
VQSIGWLAGFPVLVSEKLPALGTSGCVMLCDFSKYLLGTRQELQIDVSPHVNFLKNQMTWRVVWRGDGQPWLNNSITLADGTYKVSPFLYLTQ